MKKISLALAVIGLASQAAYAQTSVMVSGLVDFGYSYRFDPRSLNAKGQEQPGYLMPSSNSRLDSGQAQTSRLIFSGSEDLGNGMKAIFLLEQGFLLDTGAPQTPGLAFNRQAYVGMTGGFGRITGGRLYTPYNNLLLATDPFSNGTMGAYKNAWTFAPATEGSTLTNPIRADNAISYTTPSFGGFSLTGYFSNNFSGDESSSNNAKNNTMYALAGQYSSNELNIGANYHVIALGTSGASASLDKVENFTVGATYDFGWAKFAAAYAWNEISYSLSSRPSPELNNFLVGATVPFGKWAFKTSYVYSDGKNLGDSQQFAVGLNYNLSKRTDLYSAYSWIDNTGTRMSAVNDFTNSGTYSAGGAYPTAGVFQQGVQFGIRHRF